MPNRMSDFLEGGGGEIKFKGNKRPRADVIGGLMKTPSREPGGVRPHRTRAERMMRAMGEMKPVGK